MVLPINFSRCIGLDSSRQIYPSITASVTKKEKKDKFVVVNVTRNLPRAVKTILFCWFVVFVRRKLQGTELDLT